MSSQTDYRYFTDNLGTLYRDYGDRFIVVKDAVVLGAYDTFVDAFFETTKTEQVGTFIVQKCVDNPEKLIQSFQANVTFS